MSDCFTFDQCVMTVLRLTARKIEMPQSDWLTKHTISQPTASRVENGLSSLRLESLRALCSALERDLIDVIDDAEIIMGRLIDEGFMPMPASGAKPHKGIVSITIIIFFAVKSI